MKQDELQFSSELASVAPKATMIFCCQNKEIKSFNIQQSFLVGSVAGCDLRLAGIDLPSLLFQVTHISQKGFLIRSITPLSGLTLNGSTFQESLIKTNDKLNLGDYEFSFTLDASTPEFGFSTNSVSGPSVKLNSIPEQEPLKSTKSKHSLARALKRLKSKNLSLKFKLKAVQKKNHVITKQLNEHDLKDKNLQSSSEELLNIQILKNKTDQDELILLRKEIETLRNSIANHNLIESTKQADLMQLQQQLDQKECELKELSLEIDQKREALEFQAIELKESLSKLNEDRRLFNENCITKNNEQENFLIQAADLEKQMTDIFQLKLYLENVKNRLDEKESALENELSSTKSIEADLTAKSIELEKFESELIEQEIRLSSSITLIEQGKEELLNKQLYFDARFLEIEEKEALIESREKALNNLEADLLEKKTLFENELRKMEDLKNNQDDKEKQAGFAEKNLIQMQEVLRKRIEEIQLKEIALDEKDSQLSNQIQSMSLRSKEMENEHSKLMDQLTKARNELESSKLELQVKTEDLNSLKTRIETENHGHELIKNEIFEALQRLEDEKVILEEAHKSQQELEKINLLQSEELRADILKISEDFPNILAAADSTLSKLAGAKELIQEHLKEFHSYALNARQDLDALIKESRNQQSQSQETESKILKAREEHRLSIASFKQQLIEWQHKLIEIKLSLQTGESELERKQARIDSQSLILQQQTENLNKKENNLKTKEGEVLAQTKEVQRHLDEMRAWYRNKIKDLTGTIAMTLKSGYFDKSTETNEGVQNKNPAYINEIADASDRKLGDQLTFLRLVEPDNLHSLMLEAKNSKKSLRQALLNGGYLTFYQLAIIEAGNINGLMIDRFRVIDKLPSTSKEYVFQVYDPVRKSECLLRHLSESELSDPFHPDEFRQRFSAATQINHENVISTLEVLEVQGRPAVLVELIHGANHTEWATPHFKIEIWLNILFQSVSGLASIHGAGLIYGPIHQSSLIITREGIVKWTGVGSPSWLIAMESSDLTFKFKNDITNLARESLSWLMAWNKLQIQKIDLENNNYIKMVQDVAYEKLSINLDEWLIKTLEELQKFENWEMNFKTYILDYFNSNQQQLKIPA